MRIPVFARQANPSIDRPILRKSYSYAKLQVDSGKADWLDPDHPEHGILCREMLYFGERRLPVETVKISKLPGEIPGLRFAPPPMEKNPLIVHVITTNVLTAAPGWDWSREPVPQDLRVSA